MCLKENSCHYFIHFNVDLQLTTCRGCRQSRSFWKVYFVMRYEYIKKQSGLIQPRSKNSKMGEQISEGITPEKFHPSL